MKKESSFVLVLVFIVVTLFLISGNSTKHNLIKIKEVYLAGQSIKVDLALTPEEQAQGLSGRSELKENEGMLFVFEKPGIYPFWMKNMNFAIDMIWLAPSEGGDGGDARVVYIKKDARPEDYLQTFNPEQDAKYVLEVVSGFSEKNNLKEGDKVLFTH